MQLLLAICLTNACNSILANIVLIKQVRQLRILLKMRWIRPSFRKKMEAMTLKAAKPSGCAKIGSINAKRGILGPCACRLTG